MNFFGRRARNHLKIRGLGQLPRRRRRATFGPRAAKSLVAFDDELCASESRRDPKATEDRIRVRVLLDTLRCKLTAAAARRVTAKTIRKLSINRNERKVQFIRRAQYIYIYTLVCIAIIIVGARTSVCRRLISRQSVTLQRSFNIARQRRERILIGEQII